MKRYGSLAVKAETCKCPGIIYVMKHPAVCKKMYLAGHPLPDLFKYPEKILLDRRLAAAYIDIFCILVKTLYFADDITQFNLR